MITPISQRWLERRVRFVVPETVFQPRHFEVAAIPDDTTARSFVEQHHYSSKPAPKEAEAEACRRVAPRLTRPLAHGGNHKYAFALDRHVRKHLPASLPYPRLDPRVRAA